MRPFSPPAQLLATRTQQLLVSSRSQWKRTRMRPYSSTCRLPWACGPTTVAVCSDSSLVSVLLNSLPGRQGMDLLWQMKRFLYSANSPAFCR